MSKENVKTDVYSSLLKIQQELNAPKGQYNKFGKYNYRSLEDIQAAVKPLLKKVGCVFMTEDELVLIGDRHYIKATAKLIHVESGETIENTAYAREELSKKGMDASQITGTASSYARKYAANGLFAIDDTKDADTDDYKKQIDNTPKREWLCDGCGAQIDKALYDNTVEATGKAMCKSCAKKYKAKRSQTSKLEPQNV